MCRVGIITEGGIENVVKSQVLVFCAAKRNIFAYVCSRKNAGPFVLAKMQARKLEKKKTLTSIPGGEPASRDMSQGWTTACEEFDNRAKLRIRIACVKIGIEQNSEFASPAQKSEFGPSARKSEWPSPDQKGEL